MGNHARRIAFAKKQMAGIHTKKHSDARSLRLKKTKEIICKNLEMGIVAETLDDTSWGIISPINSCHVSSIKDAKSQNIPILMSPSNP